MGAGTTLGHHLLRLLVAPGRQRFERHLGELESVQRARLSRWLSAASRSTIHCVAALIALARSSRFFAKKFREELELLLDRLSKVRVRL